jgi:hypothetical protein
MVGTARLDAIDHLLREHGEFLTKVRELLLQVQ